MGYAKEVEATGTRVTYRIRSSVLGWFFRLEELPTGFWRAKGRDIHGNTVNLIGSDPGRVLSIAEGAAREINEVVARPHVSRNATVPISTSCSRATT